jgi:predicted methyltransferase
MVRKLPLVITGLVLALSATGLHAKPAASNSTAAAIADPGRPDSDKDRDANRKPAETLAFAGIKSGQQIADLYPGGGYFTRIFSKVVGAKGHVYAVWPTGAPDKMTAPIKAMAADPAYSNVSEDEQAFTTLKFAKPLDVVWTSQNYHDIHNIKDVDMLAVDKAIFAALKPGGVFIVLDHAAAAGTGFQDTNTLHRIDPEAVKKEVEAAGFVLAKQSDLLKNADDPHTAKVFDQAIRGKTDQFFFKFVKPKK